MNLRSDAVQKPSNQDTASAGGIFSEFFLTTQFEYADTG